MFKGNGFENDTTETNNVSETSKWHLHTLISCWRCTCMVEPCEIQICNLVYMSSDIMKNNSQETIIVYFISKACQKRFSSLVPYSIRTVFKSNYTSWKYLYYTKPSSEENMNKNSIYLWPRIQSWSQLLLKSKAGRTPENSNLSGDNEVRHG